jgi:P-type conjugative transfer protein TrbJ
VLFDDLLDDWAETSMDSIKGAMLAANRQADEFESEEEVFAEFRNLSSSVDGQMEAISVGNQIAVEQAVQMQKLRQLMMAQMQAQNAYMASDQAREEETRQRMKEMLREPTREEVRASYNGT